MSFWSPGRAAKPSLAVDLGTAFTRVWARGRGLVSETPSRVRDARPLRGGVVVDVERAAQLLEPLLWRARRFGWGRPAVLACAPSDASPQEVERLRASLCRAGAANVRVEPEPLAAAVGAGVDPGHAQLLADVGAGVADVALLRGGRILRSWALRGDGLADRSAAVADLLRRAWRELSRAESCEALRATC